ncbi:ATP-binding response regulator [Lyngbya confervoides]|uniref:histidine kinase n=1 Tax=Lyngbya confervoides BDU141951 TaxID=1574623 RepID=A0ABD4SZ87_9CYAN|nr:hybrid sensor histidine kinase/response regulator [Lyngbya confervoides]MCM1981568.1 hybrid sensor histidine kinase/response regulator [Lyngbya confervoides BDU141951]
MSSFPSADYLRRHDRILVVDDRPSSFIASILSLEGYDTDQCLTPAVALAQISTHPPQLLVSKMAIPAQSGLSLSQQVRTLTPLPYIPILLIAEPGVGGLVQGLDSGADDFLRQPVEVDELLARVRSLLRLKHTMDDREHMMQVREEFLSRLTHDLRVPLVAADRMFTLLRRGKYGLLPERVLGVLTSMQENNQDLLHMTNTLLDIYRYEAGSKTLSFTPFNLRSLVETVVSELTPLAEGKHLKLLLEMEPPVPVLGETPWMLRGAKLELRRVLTNLISNALKFTDQGHIKLSLSAQSGGYELQVQDTGCGIPATDLPYIFDRFYQGQHHRSGCGLGLNLVQQIVQAHQGTIRAHSVPGEGTCLTLWLPSLPQPVSATTRFYHPSL